jgi:hypothetical protein
MKTLENYSDWSGQWEDYELFGVTQKGQKINLTKEFVGDIIVHNSGDSEKEEGKLLSKIDKEEYDSAYYEFKRPNPMDKSSIIIDKIVIF